MMLSKVIEFVASRTDLRNRADILREINNAWEEIWYADDLPNSMFEITMKGSEDSLARITLPFFVGKIRAVKLVNRQRIELQTPRPYYHDLEYEQSPYTWRILGEPPISRSITNASRVNFTLASPNESQFKIVVIGSADNAYDYREQIIFPAGSKSVWTENQYTDFTTIAKDTLIVQNVNILGANGEKLGIIPNLYYEAVNTLVQIHDKCNTCCTSCQCFDILYKKRAPILHYDEQIVPYPQVLMTKTLEWITLPKDGQEQKAILYGEKSKSLIHGFNRDDTGVTHKLDFADNPMFSHTGYGSRL